MHNCHKCVQFCSLSGAIIDRLPKSAIHNQISCGENIASIGTDVEDNNDCEMTDEYNPLALKYGG